MDDDRRPQIGLSALLALILTALMWAEWKEEIKMGHLPQYEVSQKAEGSWWAVAGTLGVLAGQLLVAVGVSPEISVTIAALVTGSVRWGVGLLLPNA